MDELNPRLPMGRQLPNAKLWFWWAAFTGAVAVEAQPVITTQPISQTVNAGTTVNFQVAATGTQPIRYQ